MSAVSITHKTVGIRLPRLRRGANGVAYRGWMRTKRPIKFHPVQRLKRFSAGRTFTSMKVGLLVKGRIEPARLTKVPFFFHQPCSCVCGTARTLRPIPERTLKDYPRQKYAFRPGLTGSTLWGEIKAVGQYGQVIAFNKSLKQAQK